MSPDPMKDAARLESGDLVVSLCDDPAYMALVDIHTYAKDLPDWDYATLTKRIVDEMNAGHIVAWGCPEALLQVRITRRALDAETSARVVAKMRSRLSTQGELCLAGYTSLTMCAQFEKDHFPQSEDFPVRIEAGTYDVEVHRLFAYTAGEQSPDGKLPPGDHYIVVLTPAVAGSSVAPQTCVPWAPS